MPALVRDRTASMQRLAGPRPSAVLAPAPRRPLRPQRATCVVRAGALDELEAWQRDRLQQAAAAGRRQVKVRPGAPAAGFEPTKTVDSCPHLIDSQRTGLRASQPVPRHATAAVGRPAALLQPCACLP